jgi:hypothetical protein
LSLGGTNHEEFPRQLDHFFGDITQFIDLNHPLDLTEQTLEEPEIPTCCPGNSGDGFNIDEVAQVEAQAQLLPLMLENEVDLLAAQRLEVMHKPLSGVELWVARETLLEAWHPDEH